MSFTVEKDWITEAGLRAVVIATGMGHRCGYVAIPSNSPLATKSYVDLDIEVHGGLTYGGGGDKYPVDAPDLHWFGFDCAHLYDAKDTSIMDKVYLEIHKRTEPLFDREGIIRDTKYCINECESLARQLKDYPHD